MRLKYLIAVGLGLACAGGQAAHAYDIRFIGQSKASPQLKRDVLTAITALSKHQYSCAFVFSIESALLPADFTPRTPMQRMESPEGSYERWEANLCGTKHAFLIGLAPSPKGGADYKVTEIKQGVEP